MKHLVKRVTLCLALGALVACQGATPTAAPKAAWVNPTTQNPITVSPEVPEILKALPRTKVDYDRSLLNEKERAVVDKLIEAARYIDTLYWLQVEGESLVFREMLVRAAKDSPQHKQALELYDAMKGRWNRLDADKPFVGPLGPEGAKPAGAGFYPPDVTKEEIEKWIAAHPEDKDAFQGLFTVIRRDNGKLVAIPYNMHYAILLAPATARLKEAAELTDNASLKNYLTKLAEAFNKNDYYESDLAWMDLQGPIEVVMGPYEVYEDNLFNYKAAYEAFVTVVDAPESKKLEVYGSHLVDMEMNLPMPDKYKNPNRGKESPIKVVQELFTAGDARRGVQTAAFNLPNDERVREAKGSKKVLLKNVMEAKFHQIGQRVAERVLDPAQVGKTSFDAFFTHVLFHEISHGLGPGFITQPDGSRVENRLLLKDLYSTLEEAKADSLGVYNILYMIDKKLITSFTEEDLAITNVGLMFRSMRFGLEEAHGAGTAIQWNWMREKQAIVPTADGRFKVDLAKVRAANKSLAEELLLIEATGDYDRGARLVAKYAKSTPEIEGVIAKMKDMPVDITPYFPAAGEQN